MLLSFGRDSVSSLRFDEEFAEDLEIPPREGIYILFARMGRWMVFIRQTGERNRIDGLARCPRTPTDSVQRVDRYNGSRDRAALI